MSMTVYGHEIMLQETVGTYREKKSESEHKNRACHGWSGCNDLRYYRELKTNS